MMETYSLFPANIFKYKAEPTAYDKVNLISACARNYAKAPYRNCWDKVSNLHQTHNDWNNPEFEVLDERSLVPIYVDVCTKVLEKINLKINFRFIKVDISNITVNTVYMNAHNHFSGYTKETSGICLLTGVHYVSLGKEHAPTIFINPSMGFELNRQQVDSENIDEYFNLSEKIFDVSKIENSFYSREFCLPTEEDDIVLFPAHLNHIVKNDPQSFSDKPRIVVAFNITAAI